MQPKQKGELTEQIVICEFLKRGIPVSKPIGDNQPYDLIIDINEKLLKVQTRTARIDKKNEDNVIFNSLSYRNNTKTNYVKDNRSKFDLFVSYYPLNGVVYAIESNKVLNNICRFTFNEDSRLKVLPLAKDYTLDKWIEKLNIRPILLTD